MRSRMGGLRRQFMENNLITTQLRSSHKLTSQEKEDNIINWVTLFRRNWHIFVDLVLQIKLKPFQALMIYLMGVSDVFFAICSRGLSKTFMVGLAAIVKMLLYPYSEVIITASTIAQANVIVEKKIRDELIKKLSPYLLFLYDKEYLVITKSDDGYKITCALNSSTLEVLPANEGSRGRRATLVIYEECRLLKKGIIDSVFDKMGHPRQAKYIINNPEFAKNKRWIEECQSIYITSARYRFEWFWRTFKDCVTGYYNDKKTQYNVFAGDIFLSIANGLKTWGDLRRSRKMSSDMDYRMEDLNEMIGEAEDAFFKIQNFKENQTLEQAFIPPTSIDIYTMKDLGNAPKKDNELRLVITDYAFANTTSREANDNTIIMLMSLHWKGNRFERHVDYIEGHPASDSLGAADRARELFWDYQADYYVPDLRSGGEVLYNRMTMQWEHPERGNMWNSCGFTVVNDKDLHVVPSNKIDDLVGRTVDKNALPCIIPVVGTSELNAIMWVELKKQLESNNIKFLIPTQNRQGVLEDNGRFFELSSEDLAQELAPYGQVDLMIQEAVNLSAEFKDGRVKLKEPRSFTKDRAVCLSYGNYIASKLENKYNQSLVIDDFDIDDIQLVF